MTTMEGYLLKKKRKKMQGMARRYFQLAPTGALSYSFDPKSPIRDSVFISLAFVSASRKRRTFHIDSGRDTWHCKALTEEDFDKWAQALKSFVGEVKEEEDGKRLKATAVVGGADKEAATEIDLEAIFAAVAKMTVPIQEIDAVYVELKGGDTEGGTVSHTSSTLSNSKESVTSPKFKFLKKSTTKDASKSDGDYFSGSSNESLAKQLGQSLAIIKQQHELLASTINKVSQDTMKHGGGQSPKTYASRSSAAFSPRPSSSRTTSIASNDTEDDYHDAMPGEFILEDEEGEDEANSGDESGQTSESEEEEEGEDSDTSFTSVEEEDSKGKDDDSASGGEEDETATVSGEEVKRREQLPKPVAGDEFSMLGMLRKNVGKDLSTISFPVTINEPLSALQRIAEELEYSDLLHKAAREKDSIERLTLVTAFAIAGNAGNKYRTSRKPFNPLLGETYELLRPDKGFKFISEKVSHHPPIMAFHGDAKGWKVSGHVAPTQKFWGRSMEVFATGDYHITFEDTGDTFSIKKSSSFVRNLVAGTKYLEVVGDMVVANESSGEKATINFKEGSTFGGAGSRNKFDGKVCDEDGNAKVELVGKWDENIDKKEGKSNYTRLWEIGKFPSNPGKYYGLSVFASQLNEITDNEKDAMAPTDSRLRPDQRALEDGDVDTAEETKKKVEEKQRAKRKEGKSEPKFFKQKGNGWSYGGQYWEKREKHEFEDPDIF